MVAAACLMMFVFKNEDIVCHDKSKTALTSACAFGRSPSKQPSDSESSSCSSHSSSSSPKRQRVGGPVKSSSGSS